MEVHHVASHHVVLLSGIDEVVGLRAGIFTGSEEGEGVLEHAGAVVQTDDDLQTSLQVLRLVQQRAAFVALGILLRRVHVAFTIHHLIVFPINDGSPCDADFEDIGVGAHQVRGHETAERPAVHAEAVLIYIGKRGQKLNALHLVFHLDFAEVAEGDAFKLKAAVLGASVVHNKNDITLLCHVGFPRTHEIVPGFIDVVGVGTTIDIDDGGIFLGGVKADGFDEAVVEVCLSVSSLYRSATDFGHFIVLPGRSVGLEHDGFCATGADEFRLAEGVGGTPAVQEPGSAGAERGTVSAATVVEKRALQRLEIDGVEVVANGRSLVAFDDDGFGGGVEAEELEHLKLSFGQLFRFAAGDGHEVEVIVAVTASLVDELIGIPRQEDDGVHRFDIFRIGLGVEHCAAASGGSIVGDEFCLVLRAGQFDDIDGLLVG